MALLLMVRQGRIDAGGSLWSSPMTALHWSGLIPISKCCEPNCVPPNSYVEVLTPSTSECDCIWRWSLQRGDKGEPSSNMTEVLIRRGDWDTDMCRGKNM